MVQPAAKAKLIFKIIKAAPGVRYRELLRSTGLVNGMLSYQLRKLEKKKLVKVKRLSSAMTRYYPATVKAKESDILDYILPITKRKIILYLLEHDKCTFNEIPDYVKKDPSTTSSHLKDLKDAGIIVVFRDNISYSIRMTSKTHKLRSR
jgi:predicted transcriptional regulator